jgi:hypothetical protein
MELILFIILLCIYPPAAILWLVIAFALGFAEARLRPQKQRW